MTLHYAPTTPEEEELALALALSASLSSAGKAASEPARTACARQSSARIEENDCAIEADQYLAARAPTSPRTSAVPPAPAPALNISLNPNPSLIYPQLPPPPLPPPAHRKPSSLAPPRPSPAASSSANALLQQQRPPAHAPHRHVVSTSPPRSRWAPPDGPSSSTSSSGGGVGGGGRAALSSQPAGSAASGYPPPSPGRSTSPSRAAARPPVQYPQPQHPSPYHAPQHPHQPQHTQPLYPPIHPPGPHLPPIALAPPPPPIPRSKSAAGPGGMFGGGVGAASTSGGGRCGAGATTSTSTGGGIPAPAPPAQAQQLFSDPDACAGCGRGFGVLTRSWVTGMGRKWHAGCFKCGFCREPISSGQGAFSYQMASGDPLPYHPDCYRHVHHPMCHVCGSYIAASPDGVIAYRENGFWREKYCTTHLEGQLTRCCACSRLQKQGEEWAPLPDGRSLCLQCLSSVVLDTPDAQPLYDEVLGFYTREMRLPHAYKPPLLLVDGNTLNSHAEAEGRDDSAGAPVFHVRGLCVAHVYSHIPSILRGAGGTIRSIATELLNSHPGAGSGRVHCEVKVLLLLYGLPRLLCGSIMAHELMHAWLRMEGLVGLSSKVEEGLCQLMACLWLDRQHELLRGKPEEQRLASFFSYQIRTDTSEVYGEGFREAMEAFQAIGLTAVIQNVKRYRRFTPP